MTYTRQLRQLTGRILVALESRKGFEHDGVTYFIGPITMAIDLYHTSVARRGVLEWSENKAKEILRGSC